MMDVVVVGSDGLIGSAMVEIFSAAAHVTGTTRRASRTDALYVNLESGEHDSLRSVPADIVVFCAGMTRIQDCEQNPDLSRRVNVDETLRLIDLLVQQGSFVVWLSSNTVFDCTTPFPEEDAPYSPSTEYGRQKVEVETRILNDPNLARNVAIVRLSKVLSKQSAIVAGFLAQLKAGLPCPAFDDLSLSPASLSFVCNGLKEIALAHRPGIFHLSGGSEMTYADFARHLAKHVGADQKLVQPVRSVDAGVDVLFSPLHPALGMTETQKVLGISPEPLETTLSQLI